MTSAQLASGCRTPALCVQILYSLLLLWTKEMHGLSDFSIVIKPTKKYNITGVYILFTHQPLPPDYLFRIINSHSAQACDGDILILRCPRHSTITVQSAFYGQSEALPETVPTLRCQWSNRSCSATAALQKVLYECQGHRDCQLLVNHQVFGEDPCPGTPNISMCHTAEHKKKVMCEGNRLLLHCKYPKVLNIYSAIYGRPMEEDGSCPSETGEHPPFECLFHGAVDVVTNICYGKQRCFITIDKKRFKDPCPPGTKNSTNITQEADPSSFQTTSVPNQSTKDVEHPVVRSSKFPESMIIASNALMVYGYITEHPEMAGLLFTSSICVGLLIVLIVVSTQINCSRHLNTRRTLNKKSRTSRPEEEEPMNQDIDDEEDSEDQKGSESLMDSSNLSEIGRKLYCWEDVTYTTEAAELMERIERRDLVIQEIRMNAYLNGNIRSLH